VCLARAPGRGLAALPPLRGDELIRRAGMAFAGSMGAPTSTRQKTR
jgi:hypothetical protein